MSEQVTVIAYHRAKPGRKVELRQALLSLCAPTRAEKGCINYDLHQFLDDSSLLVFHENWASQADLDTHLASPHIDTFRAGAGGLLAEPPNLTLWRQLQ